MPRAKKKPAEPRIPGTVEIRATLAFTPEEYEKVKQAAYASGAYRLRYYAACVRYVTGLSAAERGRIVREHLGADDEGGE